MMDYIFIDEIKELNRTGLENAIKEYLIRNEIISENDKFIIFAFTELPKYHFNHIPVVKYMVRQEYLKEDDTKWIPSNLSKIVYDIKNNKIINEEIYYRHSDESEKLISLFDNMLDLHLNVKAIAYRNELFNTCLIESLPDELYKLYILIHDYHLIKYDLTIEKIQRLKELLISNLK